MIITIQLRNNKKVTMIVISFQTCRNKVKTHYKNGNIRKNILENSYKKHTTKYKKKKNKMMHSLIV